MSESIQAQHCPLDYSVSTSIVQSAEVEPTARQRC